MLVEDHPFDYKDFEGIIPHRLPTVSTPLDWKEVKPGLDPTQFTIDTMMAEDQKKGRSF
jgi:bifunctional non-homologous end joining protein LigD